MRSNHLDESTKLVDRIATAVDKIATRFAEGDAAQGKLAARRRNDEQFETNVLTPLRQLADKLDNADAGANRDREV